MQWKALKAEWVREKKEYRSKKKNFCKSYSQPKKEVIRKLNNTIRDLQDTIKWPNIWILEAPGEWTEKKEGLLNELITENFPNLEKERYISKHRKYTELPIETTIKDPEHKTL